METERRDGRRRGRGEDEEREEERERERKREREIYNIYIYIYIVYMMPDFYFLFFSTIRIVCRVNDRIVWVGLPTA